MGPRLADPEPGIGNHHRETGTAGYRRPLEMPRLEARLMPPTLATGKICNIEMPAIEVARSAGFFRRIFGRNIRTRGDGSTSFGDTTGQVSGTWVLGRRPEQSPAFCFTSRSSVWPHRLRSSSLTG